MPGYNPTAVANNARNANTVAVAIGQNVIAFAQSIDHRISTGAETLYAVGSPKPQEIPQLRFGPSITVTAFALTDVGVDLLANSQTFAYIMNGNQFDLYILDGLNSETTLFAYVGCKISDFSESISANTPIRDTYSFLALDVLDPNGNSLLTTGESALPTPGAGAQPLGAAIGFQP